MNDVEFSIFRNENYIDLNMYQCGREKCKPGHIFGPAARNHYLFHYVLEGRGTLMAAGTDDLTNTFEISAGQGFLLFPGQISTYIADARQPWTYCWIEFDGLQVKEALDRTQMTMDDPVYRSHTPQQRELMVQEMLYLIQHMKEPTLHLIGHLFLFFSAFVESTRRWQPRKSAKMADFYIREAITFIEQNYTRDFSIEDIAATLGIDRGYFGKLFKRATGQSPQQFLIQYRLIKAANLLKTTELSIREVANSVGYENQLHFSRAFRKMYEMSPREYKKEYAKLDRVHPLQ
ncbi:AraC family transcriptional regulator [Faecalibaculum rodentium]|uniref:AraC family transcriptional regulator n=5 Tax=Faecalibaculum rodentium TaxID=1702221 RepID=UPI0023F3A208|nr:AraC family transcriptional regulator [Faecalibaculum rodentium]